MTAATAEPEATPEVRPDGGWRARGLTRGAVVGVACGALGLLIGSQALSDNSFLTHLTTGHLILDGHFPHRDVYTFTAHGRPWVVQSWLASVAYASFDSAFGLNGIRALIAVVSAVLAMLIWRLSRPARTLVGRLLAVAGTLAVSGIAWGPRPLVFGLLFFALTAVIVEERRDPRWLVPIFWAWVNTHGSFPLGIVVIVLGALGRRLDGEEYGPDLKALQWAVAGTLLGVVNPTGLHILLFPVELLQRQKVLSLMIEWQAPTFSSTWQRLFLMQVVATVVLLPRLGGRSRYRSGLLLSVFVASALLGSRNIMVASIVLVPILARELRGLGSLRDRDRARGNTVLGAVLVVLGGVLLAARLSAPALDLSPFPVKSLDRLEAQGLLTPDHRIAARDFVGNYLEWRTRGKLPVFVDDRVDMLPDSVVDDERTLMSAGVDWRKVLDRWQIDTVVWERSQPLATVLLEAPGWKLVARDHDWLTFRRVTTP